MRRVRRCGIAVVEAAGLSAETSSTLPAEASSSTASVHSTAQCSLAIHCASSSILSTSCGSSSVGEALGLDEVEDSICESELDDGLFRRLLATMLGRRRVLANAKEGRRHDGEATSVLAGCREEGEEQVVSERRPRES
mgnify:CR=1 FL=1